MIIHLNSPVTNASLQVGDMLYCVTNPSADYAEPVLVGIITEIGASYVRIDGNPSLPSTGAYLLFAKNNQCNVSSVKGYFAELTMENSSSDYVELYTVGAGVTQSSK